MTPTDIEPVLPHVPAGIPCGDLTEPDERMAFAERLALIYAAAVPFANIVTVDHLSRVKPDDQLIVRVKATTTAEQAHAIAKQLSESLPCGVTVMSEDVALHEFSQTFKLPAAKELQACDSAPRGRSEAAEGSEGTTGPRKRSEGHTEVETDHWHFGARPWCDGCLAILPNPNPQPSMRTSIEATRASDHRDPHEVLDGDTWLVRGRRAVIVASNDWPPPAKGTHESDLGRHMPLVAFNTMMPWEQNSDGFRKHGWQEYATAQDWSRSA